MPETDYTQGADAQPTAVPVSEALFVAIRMHRDGLIDEAETLYRRILEVSPRQPDALNFLGMIAAVRGRHAEAVELIQQSLVSDPTMGERYINLGNALLTVRRVDEAVAAFERAVEMVPDSSKAHCNLGVAYSIRHRQEEARRAYEKAIELDPANGEAYNNYANLLGGLGEAQACLKAYVRALELRSDHSATRRHIGAVYSAIGDVENALKTYREWLDREPDNPTAQFLLAACLGENVPDRASDAHIREIFDGFAPTFDSRLAMLRYKAPELCIAALKRAGAPAAKRLVVLDAGCGTGLCAPLVAPYAARLEGVDLSGGMLEQARARGLYDDLVLDDLTAFLLRREDTYDVVVSADTLCYFGPLEAVCRAAAGALRPDGWLVFTVERADEAGAPQGHRVNLHGRYSHTRAYVEKTLTEAGFDRCDVVEDVLRFEVGLEVRGLVVTARKPRRNPAE